MYLKKVFKLLNNQKFFENNLSKALQELKENFDSLYDSSKISKTSSKLMLYNVEDLLDLGQMESGNFRKIITKFNLKKCIQEILDVQMYKANDKQISLSQEIKVLFNTELAEAQDFHIVSDIQRV